MTAHKILLVDDHQIVLKGLTQLVLETLGKDTVIETASNESQVFERLEHNSFNLCILDIELPGIKDFDLLRSLRKDYPHMKIIINTIHEQIWYMKEFLAAGVEGILFKNIDVSEISNAIITVLSNGKYLCKAARNLTLDIDNYAYPTNRELEVLKALAQGSTTEEISKKLKISFNTTESHRKHLLEKFNAKNVADLVLKATRSGFLPLS